MQFYSQESFLIFNIDNNNLVIMGEAKRKRELGFPVMNKKIVINKSDRYFPWFPITGSRIKKYPYIGVVTMTIGLILFLVSGGANIIS